VLDAGGTGGVGGRGGVNIESEVSVRLRVLSEMIKERSAGHLLRIYGGTGRWPAQCHVIAGFLQKLKKGEAKQGGRRAPPCSLREKKTACNVSELKEKKEKGDKGTGD